MIYIVSITVRIRAHINKLNCHKIYTHINSKKCVYVCVCFCVRASVRSGVPVYVFMNVCICVCASMLVRACTCVRTCSACFMCVCGCVCLWECMSECVCVRTRVSVREKTKRRCGFFKKKPRQGNKDDSS